MMTMQSRLAAYYASCKAAIRVAALCAVAALPSHAHHAVSVDFDVAREVEIEGVVTRRMLGNPHVLIELLVERADGDEKWLAEGDPYTALLRKGWTGKEINTGERIRIVGYPARDGSKVLHWTRLYHSDGRPLGGDGTAFAAKSSPSE